MSAESTREGVPAPTLDGARGATIRLAPVGASARRAREFVREQLAGVDHETLSGVLLVATELVTNAVLHARTTIDLTVRVSESTVLVAVFDCEPVMPQERPHDVDRTDGRGIALVASVSETWGTRLHDGGKTVWAVIALP